MECPLTAKLDGWHEEIVVNHIVSKIHYRKAIDVMHPATFTDTWGYFHTCYYLLTN
jgi:hypothetical protein